MRIVVAIGGNALLRRGERPDAAPQRRHVAAAAAALADIAREHQVVVVHGNGPQVGLLALESGSDPSLSEPYPLADLVAESQGLIGLWLQQALLAEMAGEVATLVSQTVVDPEDAAFQVPTKFIGQVYDELSARRFAGWYRWTIQADRDGWRRVVASPLACDIVELPMAARLLDAGVTVVLAGGGERRSWTGTDDTRASTRWSTRIGRLPSPRGRWDPRSRPSAPSPDGPADARRSALLTRSTACWPVRRALSCGDDAGCR